MDRTDFAIAPSSIGEQIRIRRKELGLTQAQLGLISGLTQREISFYEQGEREPTVQSLARLSIALEVSVDWLLGLSDARDRQ